MQVWVKRREEYAGGAGREESRVRGAKMGTNAWNRETHTYRSSGNILGESTVLDYKFIA